MVVRGPVGCQLPVWYDGASLKYNTATEARRTCQSHSPPGNEPSFQQRRHHVLTAEQKVCDTVDLVIKGRHMRGSDILISNNGWIVITARK